MTLKIHFESPIFALCAELPKLGKASQDAYNLGGWLILLAFLKNGVAEGVTSDPHDTSTYHLRKVSTFYTEEGKAMHHVWTIFLPLYHVLS